MASERGFTLIEVLVALVIVAMALPALLMNIGTMASTSLYAREVAIAHWVAENQLQRIYLTQKLEGITPRGRQADDVRMAGQNWDWRAETEATELPGFLRLRVAVSLDSRDGDLVEISGFLRE